jgi:hypothetical protein
MNKLDRLATTGKMIDQARATQGMPMAPQGMAPQGMAPQGMPMAPQGMAPQGMPMAPGMKKGGMVKSKSSSASKRADGCAIRGKTRA